MIRKRGVPGPSRRVGGSVAGAWAPPPLTWTQHPARRKPPGTERGSLNARVGPDRRGEAAGHVLLFERHERDLPLLREQAFGYLDVQQSLVLHDRVRLFDCIQVRADAVLFPLAAEPFAMLKPAAYTLARTCSSRHRCSPATICQRPGGSPGAGSTSISGSCKPSRMLLASLSTTRVGDVRGWVGQG